MSQGPSSSSRFRSTLPSSVGYSIEERPYRKLDIVDPATAEIGPDRRLEFSLETSAVEGIASSC
jgi:hypothetical protein